MINLHIRNMSLHKMINPYQEQKITFRKGVQIKDLKMKKNRLRVFSKVKRKTKKKSWPSDR